MSLAGSVFESKEFGNFKVINDLGVDTNTKYHMVEIEFININMYGFNTRIILTIQQVRTGKIIDHYQPRLYNVACLGSMYNRISDNEYNKLCYNKWRDMIKRCYCASNASYKYYGAKGITVCHRWLCFEYFYNDLPYVPNYELWVNNPKIYKLDKDTLQPNVTIDNIVYAPNTVIFSLNNGKNINSSNKYNGVIVNQNGTYSVQINDNGQRIYCGTYNNEIAAANQYNFMIDAKNRSSELKNNVPYMNHYDVLKCKTYSKAQDNPKNKKIAIRIIKD